MRRCRARSTESTTNKCEAEKAVPDGRRQNHGFYGTCEYASMRARGSFSNHQSLFSELEVSLFDVVEVLSSCSRLLSLVGILLPVAVLAGATVHTSEC